MADNLPIREGQILTGVLFNEPMRVETVRTNGPDSLIAGLVGTKSEKFRSVTLTSAEIQQLTILDTASTYNGDGKLLRLGIQAYSLGIAYEFDPYFGLSISRVDPLPHQLSAVYDHLLKSARIRFLLADDAGAGKTIMSGLLVRELKLRGLAERILIVCPANLAFQWQRELKEKFDEKFLVLQGSTIRDQFGVNQWLEQKQVITSLDLAKRVDILPGLAQVNWDLVIVDEAHHMSWSPPSRKTARYALGELLRDNSDHMLMLTATPHKGDPDNFTLLLDQDTYADVRSIREAMEPPLHRCGTSSAFWHHAFLQNLTVAMTGTTRGAAVISLPRSQVEMTDFDSQWQDRITKVVRRVAKDLIANDEAEISEVIRRRLFEDLGNEKIRKSVAKAFADWCFERRAQLPSEWTAVDSAMTETKAREYLRDRFEACYPFHPATLSVFQRKWQALSQYQQTRGTLTMLAQWISAAYKEGYSHARREPLITLGSAPLEVSEFRAVILGQLGEPRLMPAIESDISGQQSHARALDVDTAGPLKDIHRRVGAAILFESSGGQVEKISHLPELRFALGEPQIDTTSVDSAANALETKAFFIRKIGSDGFQIRHQPTLRKVVSDRRASLDEETEVKPTKRSLIRKEFDRGATIPIVPFPDDSASIQDSPRLTLVLIEPDSEWNGSGNLRQQIAEWTKQRGTSPRLYPGSLVWCVKKPGRDLRDKIELWLAWKRVAREITEGTLGSDFDRAERSEIQSRVSDAEEAAKDEVWAGYRFVVLSDNSESDGLKVIDLGAGHASSNEPLCGRIITALKSQALLNESVGAGYIDRNWPPALQESGAWPLTSLRQSFLNGALTRIVDPDTVLRNKIVEFVGKCEFGLGSGQKPNGQFERVWFDESLPPDEISFDPGVFLLKNSKAELLKKGVGDATAVTLAGTDTQGEPVSSTDSGILSQQGLGLEPSATAQTQTLHLVGTVPPEVWNRLGTKLIPKLRSGNDLRVGVQFSVTFDASQAKAMEAELRQILEDLGLSGTVLIEKR